MQTACLFHHNQQIYYIDGSSGMLGWLQAAELFTQYGSKEPINNSNFNEELYRNSEEYRCQELSLKKINWPVDQSCDRRVCEFEIKIRDSAICTTTSTEESESKMKLKMEQTSTHTEASAQLGISIILEPPFMEHSNSFDSFSPDYQLEADLFDDREFQMDLGESPVHDYLLYQEVGRVTSITWFTTLSQGSLQGDAEIRH